MNFDLPHRNMAGGQHELWKRTMATKTETASLGCWIAELCEQVKEVWVLSDGAGGARDLE